MLSSEELNRYKRHIPLPQFGIESQIRLKNAKVLIVGCGGLGNPVAAYLTAAGVGTLGLLDFDNVTESNLQRQVFYTEKDVDSLKVASLATRLRSLNSNCNVLTYDIRIDRFNAHKLIESYDLVIDCTDNFPTRYLLNDACVLFDKPFIYGSIYQYEGQVSVFNVNGSTNYRDLYPTPPDPMSVPTCETGGVLGTLPGVIGSIQANEAIKIICRIGEPLIDKLYLFDSLTMRSHTISIKNNNARSEINELIDYEEFCNRSKKEMIKEITVEELKDMMDRKEDFQLIDVREPHEAEISTLKGELIPLGEIPVNENNIARDKKVIIHCRSGARSAQAVHYLQGKLGLDNLYNLKGGILAWADTIDPNMAKY